MNKKGEEYIYKIALGLIPGIGSKTARMLLAYCGGSAQEVFNSRKGKLQKIPGIGEFIANEIQKPEYLENAQRTLKLLDSRKEQVYFCTDEDYPSNLKQIYKAPYMLYFNGNIDLNSSKILAIVGTRNITSYGRKMCEQIISELKGSDTLVVSGLAYGVDVNIHKLCLENEIPTIGVMANGIDMVYPASHRNTAEKMKNNGGILSEEHYGTTPVAAKFPARNRIVAGIAHATIVVESAAKGGSLITANFAFDYNKEVFAVPGNVGNKYSEGCNNLIALNQAHIFTSVSGIFKELGWQNENSHKPKIKSVNLNQFSLEEQSILKLLTEEGDQGIDDLSWKLGTSPNQLASTLLSLELTNVISLAPGKKYRLN